MAATTDDFSQYPRVMAVDRRWRGHIVPAPNCPRCASTNTKFCYYNNYSLSQPRYFCKGCRRYWTKGGSLRDVPIGGGCRRRRQSRVAAKPLSGSTPYMANLGHRGSRDPAQDDSVNSDSRCKSSAPEIDLAAVFARFLNQNSSPETESNIEANALSEPSLDSVSVSESRDQSDLTNQDDQILGEIPQLIIDDQMLLQEEQTEAFNVQDFVPFEESPQDVFWHDPVATLQEFDSTILYADQIRNSTNLFSGDPWSCFDASGLEIFTRP